MAYFLVACPKCHAGYKIHSESAPAQVTCRVCGQTWTPVASPPQATPGPVASPLNPAAPRPEAGQTAAPTPKPPPPRPAADGSCSSAADVVATPSSRIGSAAREDKTDPLVGQVINGFKIQSRIGSGGFGVVYRAFDTNLERSVAIKMLPPKIAKASQGLVERFLREARSAAKLSHPNIVTIHQICPYRDTYYIVMELVEGGALHEFLAVQKRFTPQEATRVIRAAAEGLGHAHRRGIIHRDIKPGNIMMTNDGQVKVSDFGLARDVLQGRDIVGPGHSLGTPRYMAPEQALGGEPTSASDLYSLAATYFALLTGHPPFEGSNDRELMKKHVTAEVPDPRKFVPDLPVAVFRFFERAMAKQAEDRYQTAEEFVEALDRLDFSKGSATASLAEALSAQIGKVTAEEKGGHVTRAIERVAVKASRQRTPLSTSSLELDPESGPAPKSSGLVWVLIIVGAVIVIGGAIAVAYLLKPVQPPLPQPPSAVENSKLTKTPGPAVTPSTGTVPAVIPSVTTSGATKTPSVPPVKAPEKTPVKAPVKDPGHMIDKGSATPPEKTPPKVTTPVKPVQPEEPKPDMEAAAQAALDEVKKFEADKPDDRITIIHKYEEIILNQPAYEKTKAYQEALKAVDRLRAAAETTPPPT